MIQTAWRSQADAPTQTPRSQALSRALKSWEFRFVRPVIVNAWMQATGPVNDHVQTCFRHAEVAANGG